MLSENMMNSLTIKIGKDKENFDTASITYFNGQKVTPADMICLELEILHMFK